jgi:SAM-dependent methyltransferase
MEARFDSSNFWDQAAGSRQFSHPLDHARFTKLIPRDAAIVDYGCGQGRLSGELIGLGYAQVLGLDTSPEMVRGARKLNAGGKFTVIEPGGYDSFRLPEGVLLRHHRCEWFAELLAEYRVDESVDLETKTMNGNPARVLQPWARA